MLGEKEEAAQRKKTFVGNCHGKQETTTTESLPVLQRSYSPLSEDKSI